MSTETQTPAGDSPAESLVGLINQLAEPVPPAPVSMTPQTIGWLWLLVGVILAVAALIRWQIKRRRDNAYRRAALAGLDAAGNDSAAIAAVLRRTALAAWPRADVANLTGQAWIDFLESSGGQGLFSGAVGETLISAPYRDQSQPAPSGLRTAARRWIVKHRPGPTGDAQ